MGYAWHLCWFEFICLLSLFGLQTTPSQSLALAHSPVLSPSLILSFSFCLTHAHSTSWETHTLSYRHIGSHLTACSSHSSLHAIKRNKTVTRWPGLPTVNGRRSRFSLEHLIVPTWFPLFVWFTQAFFFVFFLFFSCERGIRQRGNKETMTAVQRGVFHVVIEGTKTTSVLFSPHKCQGCPHCNGH